MSIPGTPSRPEPPGRKSRKLRFSPPRCGRERPSRTEPWHSSSSIGPRAGGGADRPPGPAATEPESPVVGEFVKIHPRAGLFPSAPELRLAIGDYLREQLGPRTAPEHALR